MAESPVRHRTTGNMNIRDHVVPPPVFNLAADDTPDSTPRSRRGRQCPESCKQRVRELRRFQIRSQLHPHRWYVLIAASTTVLLVATILYKFLFSASPPDVVDSTLGNLDRLYEEKLKHIASAVAPLESLGKIVVKADQTYEDVYHNQLVMHSKESRDPQEEDWNGFVKEARVTGPVFLAGKERLREAVAHMQRLIRRAPDHLKSMVHWLSLQNSEEAEYYLNKVVKLVDGVHTSMEQAADRFASAETTIGGMTGDAKENAEHFQAKASKLEVEAKALESGGLQTIGKWSRHASKALYGCQLEYLRTSLADCKMQCVNHATGSCSAITFYMTSSRSNCYLHCESASQKYYLEADVYSLDSAPEALGLEASQKTYDAAVATNFQARWENVQAPLREVTRLVRKFRAATSDLRGSLEEARFVTNDLRAAFSGDQSHDSEKQVRMTQRLVEDVIAAIEDLGDSLAVLRFEENMQQAGTL